MGMSRAQLPDGVDPATRPLGPIYMKALAESGVIQENIFAFYLESFADENDYDIVSFVDIGEVVLHHMRPGVEVVYFNLAPHMYWMIERTMGVRFGDPEIEDGAYAW